MRDDRERLLDILGAIGKIEQIVYDEKYSGHLHDDELVEVWMIHHLQIIGEAASRLSKEFKEKHAEVAWGGMIGMRHVLVHGYFETDTEIVWRAVDNNLPTLKKQLETILAEQA
jgi:uncharacterized protein with HEPN domain